MKHYAHIECAACSGEACFSCEVDPCGGVDGPWRLVGHECEPGCPNHPAISTHALYAQLEDEEQTRSERNSADRDADYWSEM